MTHKTELESKHVKSKKLAEGVWIVGWLFETQKSGEDMVRALGDLYNAFDAKQKESVADGEDVRK